MDGLLPSLLQTGIVGVFAVVGFLFWDKSRPVATVALSVGVFLACALVLLAALSILGCVPRPELIVDPKDYKNLAAFTQRGYPVKFSASVQRGDETLDSVELPPFELKNRRLVLRDASAERTTVLAAPDSVAREGAVQGYLRTSDLGRWNLGSVASTAKVTKRQGTELHCERAQGALQDTDLHQWEICVHSWFHSKNPMNAGTVIRTKKSGHQTGKDQIGLMRGREHRLEDADNLFVRILSLDLRAGTDPKSATFLLYRKIRN